MRRTRRVYGRGSFLRTHGDESEHGLGRQCFGNIALFGRRTVTADIADFIRRNTGVFQRKLHTFLHGFFLRLGNVAAVAVGTIADKLGIDFRTARTGVFQFFQYKKSLRLHR